MLPLHNVHIWVSDLHHECATLHGGQQVSVVSVVDWYKGTAQKHFLLNALQSKNTPCMRLGSIKILPYPKADCEMSTIINHIANIIKSKLWGRLLQLVSSLKQGNCHSGFIRTLMKEKKPSMIWHLGLFFLRSFPWSF